MQRGTKDQAKHVSREFQAACLLAKLGELSATSKGEQLVHLQECTGKGCQSI